MHGPYFSFTTHCHSLALDAINRDFLKKGGILLHSSKNLTNFVNCLAKTQVMKKYILFLITAISGILCSIAQPLDATRFEERTFSLGGGSTHLLDTYLSPLKYKGGHVAIMDERFSQKSVSNKQWFAQSLLSLHGHYTLAAENRGLMVAGMAHYAYTYFYRPLHTDRWNLYVGPQGQLRIGGVYNLRNSNNPAQLKLCVNLSASAMGKYSFALWQIPMNVRLQADIPLLGVAFAPDYGQSYYEIFYLGHGERCVHYTSPYNNPSLRTDLSCDMQFRSCSLRLTWLQDFYYWRLGRNQYRMNTCSLMIGYVSNLYKVFRGDISQQYIPY